MINKKIISLILLLAISSFASYGCALDDKTISSSEDISVVTESTIYKEGEDIFSNRDMDSSYSEDDSTIISISTDETNYFGSGIQLENGIVKINEEGTYIFEGKGENLQIIVDSNKESKIHIIFRGLDIENNSLAPLYIKNADKVFLTLESATTNKLSVNGEILKDGEVNIDGVIFSKEDLTINGDGELNIISDFGNGIVSKDDLKIVGGILKISVSGHGLEGKDSINIANAYLEIVSGKDGLNSSNDGDIDKGNIYIESGNIRILAKDDGIHGENKVTIYDGNIDILESYEGIEGKVIDVYGGNVDIISSDDGINATSSDSQGNVADIDMANQQFQNMGRPDKGGFEPQEGVSINIYDGEIYVNAEGDGIDSNGNVNIIGGSVYVNGPTRNGNGALDYNGDAIIKGGTFIAVGSSGMAENFSEDSTQGSILVNTENMGKDEFVLKDSQGNILVNYLAEKEYNSVLISMSEIKSGESYTIEIGDKIINVEMEGLIYGEGSGGFGPGKGDFPNRPDGDKRPPRIEE